MTGREADTGRMRAIFASEGARARPREDCPRAEDIWQAATGLGDVERRRQIVLHTAECPVCAEAWRLARELADAEQGRLAAGIAVERPGRGRGRWLAAAAAVVLMVAGVWVARLALDRVPGPSSLRDGGAPPRLVSLVEGRALDAAGGALEWSGAPEGATYSVVVTDERLAIVTEARDLVEPRLVLSPRELAAIEPGGHLLWQVVARLPDGRRVESPTFANVVGRGGDG